MRKVKLLLAGLGIAIALTSTPVHAQKIKFTLTVTRNGQKEDNVSKRNPKNDNEQYAYVTLSSFFVSVTMLIKSAKCDQRDYAETEEKAVTGSMVGQKMKLHYTSKAKAYEDYRLRGRYGILSLSGSLNAQGNYNS